MASGSITSKCWPHLTHSTEFLLCIAKTEPPHFPRSIDGFGACELQSAANSVRIVVALSSAAPTAPTPTAPIAPNNMPASIPIPSTGPTPGTRRATRSDRGLGQERNIGNGERCRLACEESFLNAQERIRLQESHRVRGREAAEEILILRKPGILTSLNCEGSKRVLVSPLFIVHRKGC
jgi:hypothetical protein